MTNAVFKELIDDTYNKCIKLIKEKGFDYTGGVDDVLTYFKETAKEDGISPLKVCRILMRKHWMAITTYSKTNGASQSEPISTRIQDMINYLMFFQALVDELEYARSVEASNQKQNGAN